MSLNLINQYPIMDKDACFTADIKIFILR